MVLDKKERIMKKIDRITLIALIIGFYGMLGVMFTKPNIVDACADGQSYACSA